MFTTPKKKQLQTMEGKIIPVNNRKYKSMVLDRGFIRLLNAKCSSIEEFNTIWNNDFFVKNLGVQNPYEMTVSEIKSIKSDLDSEELEFFFSGIGNAFREFSIAFSNYEDKNLFLDHFERELNFKRSIKQLSPIEASYKSSIFLIAFVVYNIYWYNENIAYQNGLLQLKPNILPNKSIDIFGITGTIFVDLVIGFGILFFAYSKFKKPPEQIELIRISIEASQLEL